MAQEIAGGRHHFRFVQLPFNLAMTEALTLGNQSIRGETGRWMEAASELDITLIASVRCCKAGGEESAGLCRGSAWAGERHGTGAAIREIIAGN